MAAIRHPRSRSDRLARLYARFAGGWQESITRLGYPQAYDLLVSTTHPVAARRVADIGAGSGALAQAWLRAHPRPDRLTLLDNSPDMLEQARRLMPAGTELAAGQIGDDCIGPDECDVILCAHVIEHTRDPEASLRWFRSRLAPAGRLFLSVSRPHWCTALVRWRWGHQAFEPDQIRRMLERAGFAGIELVAYRRGPPSRTSMGYRARRP